MAFGAEVPISSLSAVNNSHVMCGSFTAADFTISSSARKCFRVHLEKDFHGNLVVDALHPDHKALLIA